MPSQPSVVNRDIRSHRPTKSALAKFIFTFIGPTSRSITGGRIDEHVVVRFDFVECKICSRRQALLS